MGSLGLIPWRGATVAAAVAAVVAAVVADVVAAVVAVVFCLCWSGSGSNSIGGDGGTFHAIYLRVSKPLPLFLT